MAGLFSACHFCETEAIIAPAPKNDKPAAFPSSSQEQEFAAAGELLARLIQSPEISEVLDPDARTNTRRVYTHGVTLWMLILQRLGKGLSLTEVVSQVIHHQRDLLPENKRVREFTLSENSSAYSQARKRLPLETILEFSHRVCDYLGRTSKPVLESRRVFILDGTTITLPPTEELTQAFPPATNQHGASVWPVAMLMVANEMQSGCALLPQVDPMYGENNRSEAQQAEQILRQLPDRSVVLADSNFGIYRVAHHCLEQGHDFLFRLTKSRFKALRQRAELLDEGGGHKSYRLLWRPTAKDRKSAPGLPEDAFLEVVLHEVELENGDVLYLVSSLEIQATSSAELYAHRYDVEFDIRDVKVTMDAENIRAKSVEMVLKELMTSVVAYNLVAQFRRQAAALIQVQPRRLSFKGVWTSFRNRLLLANPQSIAEWIACYTSALISASTKKHPNRKTPRRCPRQAHPRRPKSTKFQKSQRATIKPNDKSPPPLE